MKLLFLCLFACVLAASAIGPHRHVDYRTRYYQNAKLPDVQLPPDEYFEQKLDHFHADTRTWKQLYYVNATYWDGKGPIFVSIGGEGPISPRDVLSWQMSAWAKEHNALQFALEHRFYGKSHPFPEYTVDNLSYLSSRQALADLAYFLESMAEEYGFDFDTHKLITFGGSYPGCLSAWFRLKYPHIANAAIASSAPVFAELNFMEYMQVVENAMNTSVWGSDCQKNIRNAILSVEPYLATSDGRAHLAKTFGFCHDIETTANGIANFFSVLSTFVEVVQYNGIGYFPYTITDICHEMQYSPDLVGTLANITRKLAAPEGGCVDVSYENTVKELRDTTPGPSASGRLWTYQTCAEFGFYQTTASFGGPFKDMIPLSYFLDMCKDVFGFAPTYSTIVETNNYYGGRNIDGSRIVFPNGSIDPWHALGVLSDRPNDQYAVYIHGTAHCADMHQSIPSETPALDKGKRLIGAYLNSFINDSE